VFSLNTTVTHISFYRDDDGGGGKDMTLVFLDVMMVVIWVMLLFTRMFYDCNVVDKCGCGYGYVLIIIFYIE
jgi:hypothetical protein